MNKFLMFIKLLIIVIYLKAIYCLQLLSGIYQLNIVYLQLFMLTKYVNVILYFNDIFLREQSPSLFIFMLVLH